MKYESPLPMYGGVTSLIYVITIYHPRANGKLRINQCINIDTLVVFAGKCHSSMNTGVLGQYFDSKIL
jgi:hypothetical protein